MKQIQIKIVLVLNQRKTFCFRCSRALSRNLLNEPLEEQYIFALITLLTAIFPSELVVILI